jgi:hypothetical protein
LIRLAISQASAGDVAATVRRRTGAMARHVYPAQPARAAQTRTRRELPVGSLIEEKWAYKLRRSARRIGEIDRYASSPSLTSTAARPALGSDSGPADSVHIAFRI